MSLGGRCSGVYDAATALRGPLNADTVVQEWKTSSLTFQIALRTLYPESSNLVKHESLRRRAVKRRMSCRTSKASRSSGYHLSNRKIDSKDHAYADEANQSARGRQRLRRERMHAEPALRSFDRHNVRNGHVSKRGATRQGRETTFTAHNSLCRASFCYLHHAPSLSSTRRRRDRRAHTLPVHSVRCGLASKATRSMLTAR